MGYTRWPAAQRIRNALDAQNKSPDHLQSDRQFTCGSTSARTYQNKNTVRYLGVDVEDALALAEGTEI